MSKSVQDVVAQMKGKVYAPKQMLAKLEFLWKEVVANEYNPGKMIPPFTAKQRGQLKLFLEAVGQEEAQQILKTVLVNWSAFTDYLRTTQDLKTTPSEPTLGFVLVHAAGAMQFAGKLNAPVQSIAQAQMNKTAVNAPLNTVESPTEWDAEAYVLQTMGLTKGE